MYAAKVSITIQDDGNLQVSSRMLQELLMAWSSNGQILGREHPVFINHNTINATVIIPEENALEAIYNTETARGIVVSIIEANSSALDVKIVGISPEALHLCECEEPESYILYTNHSSISPPIRCGDCSCPVPTYRIAPEENRGRSYISDWQSAYQSCDALHIHSVTGEQFSQRQMQNHNSALSKEGIALCKKLEEHSGKPFFYYLSKPGGKSFRQEKKRTCPSCKGKWLLKEPWHDMFDFKCEDCRLISNIGWSVRDSS